MELSRYLSDQPLNQDTGAQPVGELGGPLSAFEQRTLVRERPTPATVTTEVEQAASAEGLNPTQTRVLASLYKQESDAGRNPATSVDGARGVGQIMPGTFARYAKAGENIDNPADNLRVAARIVKDIGGRHGDDPARIFTGYFSGEGNINPGAGQAWKNDTRDGYGKRTSSYVADNLARMAGISNAQAAPVTPDAPQRSVPVWKDIEAGEKYQALSPDDRKKAREAYFDLYVAPQAGADAPILRDWFLSQKDRPLPPPEGATDQPYIGYRDQKRTPAAPEGPKLNVPGSVMDGAPVPAPQINPTDSRAPVERKVRAAWEAAYDANPDKRAQMEAQPGWRGQVARDRAAMYGRTDASATQAPSVDALDPRVEARQRTLAAAGEDPRFAAVAAKEGAQLGALPGQEIDALGGTAQQSAFDFDTAHEFNKGPALTNNPVTRGLVQGGLGMGKALVGVDQFLAEAVGAKDAAAAMKRSGDWIRGQEDAMGPRDQFMQRNFEGAINSIAQQLPAMVAGVKIGSEALPLAVMGMQSFGQEYSDGRAKGLNVAQAAGRAAIFAAFEVIGEKFGLHEQMQAIKGAARGLPSDQILGFLANALKKELPGELLTTTGQFATDKWAPAGMALAPKATLDDYLGQVADTIGATLMQTGLMSGGTTGLATAVRHARGSDADQKQTLDAEEARRNAIYKWQTEGFAQAKGRVEPGVKGELPATGAGPTIGGVSTVDTTAADGRIEPTIPPEADAGAPQATPTPPAPIAPAGAPAAPTSAPAATTQQFTDEDVLGLAETRFEQLRQKRDGQTMGAPENGRLAITHTPGAGLSPAEAAELAALQGARGDVPALRQLYGLTNQTENQNGQEAPAAPAANGPAPSGEQQANGQPAGQAGNQAADQGGHDVQAQEPPLLNPQETDAEREARLEREAIQGEGETPPEVAPADDIPFDQPPQEKPGVAQTAETQQAEAQGQEASQPVPADERLTGLNIEQRADHGASGGQKYVARATIKEGGIPVRGEGKTEAEALAELSKDADIKLSPEAWRRAGIFQTFDKFTAETDNGEAEISMSWGVNPDSYQEIYGTDGAILNINGVNGVIYNGPTDLPSLRAFATDFINRRRAQQAAGEGKKKRKPKAEKEARQQREDAGKAEPAGEPADQSGEPQAEGGSVTTFVSGMSRPGDFLKALAAGKPFGVEVNELSGPSLDKIAAHLGAHGGTVFVDSGAFSVFTANMREKHRKGKFVQPFDLAEFGYPEGFAPNTLDFGGILSQYEALVSKAQRAAEEAGDPHFDDSDRYRIYIVMPDIVGNQDVSIALAARYSNIIQQFAGKAVKPIIPIQRGSATLTEAYDALAKLLGGDFIVGIPSSEQAVTNDELRAFIADRGDRVEGIHILGAASPKTLNPKLDIILSATTARPEITADANTLRSNMYGGTPRAEALRKALDGAGLRDVLPPKTEKEAQDQRESEKQPEPAASPAEATLNRLLDPEDKPLLNDLDAATHGVSLEFLQRLQEQVAAAGSDKRGEPRALFDRRVQYLGAAIKQKEEGKGGIGNAPAAKEPVTVAPATEGDPGHAIPPAPIPAAIDQQFKDNKIFTQDAVAAARERMRKKLGTLNAGLDPEMLRDGMTLAGAYIEAGIRRFSDFVKAMVADLGEAIRPYLRSFYEAVRHYPGLDTKGMSTAAEIDLMEREGAAPATAKPDLTTEEGRYAVAQHIAGLLTAGENLDSIVDARKRIADLTEQAVKPGTESAKAADEAIEAGVVLAGRKIVTEGRAAGLNNKAIFDKLVDLYNRQPNLAVRSSTSVREQAYSTPVPLAYVASELAGITDQTTVAESTAGNGMLLIGAAPANAVVNELNPRRAAMLRAMGYTTTQNNAATTLSGKGVQRVIINPPFGVTKDANGDTITYNPRPGYTTNEVDHAIVFNTLDQMDDDGRAVLIVGGTLSTEEEARRQDYRGKSKREFYFNLYREYNVVDHFTVAGDLYSKQGASYPVDVIVIEGRSKNGSARALPAAELPKIIGSYDELKEKLNDARSVVPATDHSATGADGGATATGSGDGAGVVGSPRGEGQRDGGEGTGRRDDAGVPGAGAAGNGRSPRGGGVSGTRQPRTTNASGQRDRGGNAVPGDGQQQPGSGTGDQGNDAGRLGGNGESRGERLGSGLTDRRGEEQETATQVAYEPLSTAASVGTLVPIAMRDAIRASLARIKEIHGSVDSYVADALEFDPDQLAANFSAEQIDALALAIKNAEEGAGFIIGDQTGIGKGRVVAGMIRYALINDKVPIFITEKPNLYADMIRDLDDIGMTEELGLDQPRSRIFMTNGGESVPYKLQRMVDGEITELSLNLKPPRTGDALAELMDSMVAGNSLGEFRVIFTTYNQLQTVKKAMTARGRLVKHFAAGNYVIADESHNAGGTEQKQARTKAEKIMQASGFNIGGGGRASFLRDLVRSAFGTFFSSATYAKRPGVMDLYSSTNMMLAVDNPSKLAAAIQSGGVPMQQIVANMLTHDGQYIRRERTFAGVDYNTVETPVDKATAENMARAMRSVLAFSRAKEAAVKEMQKELDKQGQTVAGVTEAAQVQSANFGSTMHNLIDQMLLSLKVAHSIQHAIARMKAGEKVVLTVSNTMGSFLSDYAEEMGINTGDAVALSFADLYQRYLEKQRIVKIKPPNGGPIMEHRLSDDELGPALTAMFERIKKDIAESGFGSAPISPIDYMHTELRKAGYKTDEITGRSHVVRYAADGGMTLGSRSATIRDRIKAIDGFNDGSIDALIINQSGATGLSLHASAKFKDKRKRHMIIVQAEKNIDTHMQMLGRIHRTGQVVMPAYSQMMADIPAEMRPAAVLLKKMASLNANTTASRKSAVTAEGVVDFMNDYGGQVAVEFLRDNPDIHRAIGGGKVVPLPDDHEKTPPSEESIRKFTGYIPILSLAQQEMVYADLIERYNELIERENSMGTNKLEAKAVDLDAVTLSSQQITEQREGNSDSVFAAPANMEKVDVKRTVKPYTSAEVDALIAERLDGRTAEQIADEQRKSLDGEFNAYRAEREAKIADDGGDAVKVAAHMAQLDASLQHVRTILQTYEIGSPLTIVDANGMVVYGIVTNIAHSGRTANPAAGSGWKMTLALANGDAKSLTLSFSQIGHQFELRYTPEVTYYNGESGQWEDMPIRDIFDRGSTVRREQRWMVTGNILAGYSKYRGQIITYTRRDGTQAQGVLMNRQFDFEKEQSRAPIPIKSAEMATKFFEGAGNGAMIGNEDNSLTIKRTYYEYLITVPASKRVGGKFYLDQGLLSITGDFFKSGGKMSVAIQARDVPAVIEHVLQSDEELIVLNKHDKARDIFGLPKPGQQADDTHHDIPHQPAGPTESGYFNIRSKPAPKKTVIAYKLFRVDARQPGKLFPLFVDANKPVERGIWYDADEGDRTDKGKVKSKLGPLAFRPGWHAGDSPMATHIGEGGQPPTRRPANQVWAEVEMADDRDWQAEADRRAVPYKNSNPATGAVKGRPNPGTAAITDGVPVDGFYRYKTNPNMTGTWLIGGAMKVNRVLTDSEVSAINEKNGVADLPRSRPLNPSDFGFNDIQRLDTDLSLSEPVRANALQRLKSLESRLEAGKLTVAEYRLGVQQLIQQIERRNEARDIRAIEAGGRRRGAEWIIAKLRRGVADGTVPRNEAQFVEWLLWRNPNLANDLGIGITEKDGKGSTGNYNPLERVMTLFSANLASDDGTTGAHEILHHTERMMPPDVQAAIIKAWSKARDDAFQKASKEVRRALSDMMLARLGNKVSRDRMMAAFNKGTLIYSEHYQLYSPSEYWAVNGTRILAQQHNATAGWVERARQWLREFVAKVKDMLGLPSDAPILRALDAVIRGDGTFRQDAKMLDKEYNDHGDLDYRNIPGDTQAGFLRFFGRKESLKTFGWYDKSLSTQYNKALKDPHYGKAWSIINAMQNHVSLSSLRPAELAPGMLPKVDAVGSAARTLVMGRGKHSAMRGAANAIFAGTLAGDNVMDGVVWGEADLRSRFNLDDTGVALYKQTRAAIDASLDEVAAGEAWALAQGYVPKSLRRSIIDDPRTAPATLNKAMQKQLTVLRAALKAAPAASSKQLEESLAATEQAAKSIGRVFDTAEALKNAGYAPLMRFGKYTVTVFAVDPDTGNILKDDEGHAITRFFKKYETEGEALRERDALRARYSGQDDVLVQAGADNNIKHQLYSGISPETLALFGDAIGLPDATRKFYEVALSDRSALKRKLERKGIPGFEEDLPRVLANFITSNGRFAAQRFFLRDANNAIRYIPSAKGDVQKEAQQLLEYILDANDQGAVASGLAFMWFLGGSVSSAVVNLTQPVMMTLPYLMQHSPIGAAGAISKAMPYATGTMKITDVALRDGLLRASREGIVDAQEIFHIYSTGAATIASQLASALSHVPAIGDPIKRNMDEARARSQALGTLWGSMFAAAEGFNRRITFIAAWNIAVAKGYRNPYNFAVRAVNETQGIYNKVNRSNLARGPVGRTLLIFKQFSLMYMELLKRMWSHGGPQGKVAAMSMLAILVLAAGTDGLPFARALDDLIDAIGQMFGWNTNMKRKKREWAHAYLGKTWGDLALYGVSSLTPIDVSGRLGLGNIIPGTGLLKPSDAKNVARNVAELFGPTAGMASQIADAYEAFGEGRMGAAAAALLPKAAKDAATGIKWAREGWATDTKGRRVVPVTAGEAAVKATGFNPTTMAEESRKTAPTYQDKAMFSEKRAAIVDAWAAGLAHNDPAAVKAAQAEMNDWNRKNPGYQLGNLTPSVIAKKKELDTAKDQRILKGAPKTMRGAIGLQLAR